MYFMNIWTCRKKFHFLLCWIFRCALKLILCICIINYIFNSPDIKVQTLNVRFLPLDNMCHVHSFTWTDFSPKIFLGSNFVIHQSIIIKRTDISWLLTVLQFHCNNIYQEICMWCATWWWHDNTRDFRDDPHC